MDPIKLQIWDRLRQEFRRLRGQNLYRSQAVEIVAQDEIRMELEPRGENVPEGFIRIYVPNSELDLEAELVPDGTKFYLRDFRMDISSFMNHLAELARGGKPYLKTNPKQADYRQS